MKRDHTKHVADFKRTASNEHARAVRDYIIACERTIAKLEAELDEVHAAVGGKSGESAAKAVARFVAATYDDDNAGGTE